ncbi:MAG: hypothetical protein ACRD72_25730, partial [Candidatus Angelobacter sp.]
MPLDPVPLLPLPVDPLLLPPVPLPLRLPPLLGELLASGQLVEFDCASLSLLLPLPLAELLPLPLS